MKTDRCSNMAFAMLLALVLVVGNTLLGVTLEEIKGYEDRSEAGTLVYSISFDEPGIGKERIFEKNEFKLVPGAGRNGTTAMEFNTPDPKENKIYRFRR